MPSETSLLSLNARLSTPSIKLFTILGIFLFALSIYLIPVAKRGELNSPPEPGDGPDYDSIALSLSRGEGFAKTNDEEYQAPYREANGESRYGYLYHRQMESSLTAYRPPLLPFLMAANYRVFGRQFWATRIQNSILMAAACAIFSILLFRRFGFLPAILFAVLFVVVDSRSRDMARALLTESIAMFLLACLFWVLTQFSIHRTKRFSFLAGMFLGISILNRSVFIIWLPGLCLLIAYLASEHWRPFFTRQRVQACLLFGVVALAIPLPWFIRNCLVLNEFMPTGTQGPVALASGFSDWSVERGGLWKQIPPESLPSELRHEQDGLQREKILAKAASKMTIEWIRSNLKEIPGLTWSKVCTFWKPKNRMQAAFFIPMILGVALWLRWPEGKIAACLAVLMTVQIAATYTHYGRFLWPFLGVVFSAVTVGLWAIIVAFVEYRNPIQKTMGLPIEEKLENKENHSDD